MGEARVKASDDRGAQRALSNWRVSFLNCCVDVVHSCLPASCVLCGIGTRRKAVCDACASTLPRLPGWSCAVCALPLAAGSICGACMTTPPSYDCVRAPFAYDFPIDALVH